MFGFKWKKKYKALEQELLQERAIKNVLVISNNKMSETIADVAKYFPLRLGETIYTIQWRDAGGKFTKKNATPEQSSVVAVVVTKRNYFSLVEKFNNKEAFVNETKAVEYLAASFNK